MCLVNEEDKVLLVLEAFFQETFKLNKEFGLGLKMDLPLERGKGQVVHELTHRQYRV